MGGIEISPTSGSVIQHKINRDFRFIRVRSNLVQSLNHPLDLISSAFYLNQVDSGRCGSELDLLLAFFDAIR
jgi:hypothetical protein